VPTVPTAGRPRFALEEAGMPRKVRVTTTSFDDFGRARFTGRMRTPAENLAFALACVDAAGAERSDLLCLPETFLYAGVPVAERPEAEPLPGPTSEALAERARANRVNVVAGLVERSGERGYNVAVAIDRDGRLVGRYAKIHATLGECGPQRLTPGGESVVVDLDVGRVGLAICFDIGWPAAWQALADLGAELVVWPSAYDGGFPLQVYAWSHFYYVVSAVYGPHAKIVDVTGRVLAATSQWSRLATATIDLEKQVFHIDNGNWDRLREIQLTYGARVSAFGYSEENVFTLESNDPELPLAELIRRHDLETYRAYHARATAVQDATRGRPAPEAARP
jgi:predicted amidohydrolase